MTSDNDVRKQNSPRNQFVDHDTHSYHLTRSLPRNFLHPSILISGCARWGKNTNCLSSKRRNSFPLLKKCACRPFCSYSTPLTHRHGYQPLVEMESDQWDTEISCRSKLHVEKRKRTKWLYHVWLIIVCSNKVYNLYYPGNTEAYD